MVGIVKFNLINIVQSLIFIYIHIYTHIWRVYIKCPNLWAQDDVCPDCYQYVLILTLLWFFLVGTISALILSPSPIIPRLTYLWSAWFKSPALIPTSLKVLLHCSTVGRCPRSLACWWWTYIWLPTTLLHPHMLSTMVTLRNSCPPLLHINCGLSAGGGGRK